MSEQTYFVRTAKAIEALNENLENNKEYMQSTTKEAQEKLGYSSQQIGDSFYYMTPYNIKEQLINAGDYSADYVFDSAEAGANMIAVAWKTGTQFTVDSANVFINGFDEATAFSTVASAAAHFGLRLGQEGYERTKNYWHQFLLDTFDGVTFQDKDGTTYLGLDAIEVWYNIFQHINETLDGDDVYYDEETGVADDFRYANSIYYEVETENSAYKWKTQIQWSTDCIMKIAKGDRNGDISKEVTAVCCGEAGSTHTITVTYSNFRTNKTSGVVDTASGTSTISATCTSSNGSVQLNGQTLYISNVVRISPNTVSMSYPPNLNNITYFNWAPYPVKTQPDSIIGWRNPNNLISRPSEDYGIRERISGAVQPTGNGLATDYPAWDGAKVKRNIDENGDVNEDIEHPYYIPFTVLPDDVIDTIPATDIDKLYDPKTYYPTPEDMGDVINNYYYNYNIEIVNNYIDDKAGDDGYNPDRPSGTGINTGQSDLPTVAKPSEGADDTGFMAVYHPTKAIVKQFNEWLWSIGFDLDTFKKLFQDPMSAIISLHQIYMTPTDAGNTPIRLGYINTNILCPYTDDTSYTVDCGTVYIPSYYENALDYDPYTKYALYLPFIGFKPLSARDIVGQTLHIYYNVDIITGACVAFVEVDRGNFRATMYTFNGCCSVQIPITASNFASMITGIVGGAVGTAATLFTGGAAAPLVAAGAAAGAAGGALSGDIAIERSGNLGSNAGALSFKKPYIVVTRPVSKVAYNYQNVMGFPASTLIKLSKCSGYTRVKEIVLDDVQATAKEKSALEAILKTGVII